MNKKIKQHLTFWAKLVVTACLFWWIFDSVDLSALRSRVANLSVVAALVCVAALAFQSLLSALRLSLLCDHLASGIGVRASWQYTLVGLFFNQVLPSTIGGDAVKAWLLSQRDSWTLRLSLHCVVIDRAFGLLALIAVITMTLPWIITAIPDPKAVTGITLVVVLGVSGTLLFLFMPRLPLKVERTRVVGELRALRNAFRDVLRILPVTGLAGLYGVSMYILNVCVVWFVAQQVGIEAGFFDCLIIVPTALLISIIPISIAGWGLREGAMVAGFAYVGISTTDAVFLSVILGASMTVVGLVGGLVWMLTGAKRAHSERPASG